MTSMHFPTSVIFVNDGSKGTDGRHVTLSGAKSPKVWVTLAMSGTDLEDFDLFATPIHEYNIKGEQELDSVTVPLGHVGFPIVFGCSFLSDTYPDVS